jgi:hypothetical protein
VIAAEKRPLLPQRAMYFDPEDGFYKLWKDV